MDPPKDLSKLMSVTDSLKSQLLRNLKPYLNESFDEGGNELFDLDEQKKAVLTVMENCLTNGGILIFDSPVFIRISFSLFFSFCIRYRK